MQRLAELGSSFINTKVVNYQENDRVATLQLKKPKLRVYYGPTAFAGSYKSIAPPPPAQPTDVVSVGTRKSKTGRFRDMLEQTYTHDGVFEEKSDGG